MADKTDDLIISISTDMATVRRSLKRLEADIAASTSGIRKQFDAVGKQIDTSMTTAMQRRIDEMVGVGTRGVREWNGALADQGKELERLRAKYSPLFATINNYKATVADIRRAHALGAISADEMAAAIQRERQAALAATAAIKGRNAALAQIPKGASAATVRGFETANIAAQFQDIAVTSAMGMSPIQIALQQGTQLSAVLGQLKASGTGTGAALAAAFSSVVSPLSLVTIGTIAAGAAAVQYFAGVMEGGEKSEAALAQQAALIQQVADRWGDAVPALREYAEEQKRLAEDADLRKAIGVQMDDLLRKAGQVMPRVRDQLDETYNTANLFNDLELSNAFSQLYDDVFHLEDALKAVNEANKEGKNATNEAARVNELLASIMSSQAIPATGDLRDMINELAASARAGTDDMNNLALATAKAAAAALTARYPSRGTYNGVFRTADSTIQGGEYPALPEVGPVPTSRGAPELSGFPWEVRSTRTRTRTRTEPKTAEDRFGEDMRAIRDRANALAEEMKLVGLSNEEAIKRRTALDLEQQALRDLREEARKKGVTDLDTITLSQDKVDTINREAAAYAAMSEALRRAQEQNAMVRDVTKGFVSDLMRGTSAADAFANSLQKIADKLINDVLDSILQVNGASSGATSWLGSVLGLFGGSTQFAAAKAGTLSPGLFASGGYTGPGGKYQPAGIVHRGEYVIPKAVVDKIGVGNIERLMAGYANGGLVSPPTLHAPRMPDLASVAANRNAAPQITYAPQIDNRGASVEAVARLEQAMARERKLFEANVINAIQLARGRGVRI